MYTGDLLSKINIWPIFFQIWTPKSSHWKHENLPPRWPAPLYNFYFDSFLLICTSFVFRARGIVCVVYLLIRLANREDPCKRCVVALSPLLNHTWLPTPSIFKTFALYNFTVKWIHDKNLHMHSCKLSCRLGVYPIYTQRINRGYYMVARRYEFYVRVARTISHLFTALTHEI